VEAVGSALAQTFTDLEVIVADDGSTDGSPELVEALEDDRVAVLRLDHSGLPAVARNAGVAQAKGEFLAFLDSDDVWLPEKLEQQLAALDDRPNVGLVTSNARVIDEAGNEIQALYLRPDAGASGNVLEQLLGGNFIVNSSAVTRRGLFEQAGRFSEDPRLRAVEDYELWLRLASLSEVAYLPDALLLYREHGGSLRRRMPPTSWELLLVVIESLEGFLAGHEAHRRRLLARRRAGVLLEIGLTQISARKPTAAVRTLGVSLKREPAATAATMASRETLGKTWDAVRSALRPSTAG
jgi:glycosyltransferase involved in cell wall biosynthesis